MKKGDVKKTSNYIRSARISLAAQPLKKALQAGSVLRGSLSKGKPDPCRRSPFLSDHQQRQKAAKGDK